MMEKELKEKVLGEMFVIKAGISIIAEENDKIERVKSQISENEKTLQNNKYTIENYKRSMDSCQKNIDEKKNGMNNIFLKVGVRLGVLAIAVVLSVIGFIAGVSMMATDTSFESEISMMGIVLMAISLVVIIAVPPFVLLSKNRTKLSNATYYKNQADNLTESYNDYARRLKETEAHTLLTESEAKYLQAKLKSQISQSAPVAQATYMFLLDNCRNYITELHFDKVDLIIYYIYAGLADTVKEALQEVQKDIRNEEILNELRNQGSLIRQSIESGFQQLSFTITQSVNALGAQLAKQHNQMIDKIGSIGNDVSAKLSEIEAGQRLQSSLSANINKSSVEAGKSLKNIETYIRLYSNR